MYSYSAESLCCKPETNTIVVNQLYFNIKETLKTPEPKDWFKTAEKDLCSPLPSRALKSQLTAEQSSTGRHWIPSKTSEPMKFLACLNNRATINNVFWKLCYIHLIGR